MHMVHFLSRQPHTIARFVVLFYLRSSSWCDFQCLLCAIGYIAPKPHLNLVSNFCATAAPHSLTSAFKALNVACCLFMVMVYALILVSLPKGCSWVVI